MINQEKNLTSLFQQLGNKSEKSEAPDLKLKDAVFSTIDATALVADIVDLFTFKFIQAQAEVLDSLPNSEYGNEKHKLFKYLEKTLIAMKSYLATIGRDKVGFTTTNKAASPQPDYIQGVRGVVERNTMRYYLAIDAYLAALTVPPDSQPEKRFQLWFHVDYFNYFSFFFIV